MSRAYSAGIYEQAGNGWRQVTWSRHATADAARRAARKYARAQQASSGGAHTWSAWYDDAGRRVEIARHEVA